MAAAREKTNDATGGSRDRRSATAAPKDHRPSGLLQQRIQARRDDAGGRHDYSRCDVAGFHTRAAAMTLWARFGEQRAPRFPHRIAARARASRAAARIPFQRAARTNCVASRRRCHSSWSCVASRLGAMAEHLRRFRHDLLLAKTMRRISRGGAVDGDGNSASWPGSIDRRQQRRAPKLNLRPPGINQPGIISVL